MSALAPTTESAATQEFLAPSPGFHLQEKTVSANAAAALARPQVRRLPSRAPHLLLVANARASGLQAQPELVDGAARLLKALGGRVELHRTFSLDELAATIVPDGRRVVLMGGDGSLHAVANLPGPKPELALIPAGKANNVATALGVPRDLRAAARLAASGTARPIDAIAVENSERRYLAVEGVSVGFHALARSEYRAANSADTLAGIKAGIGALARFGSMTLAVEHDGTLEVLRAAQLFVVNFPLFGPSLRVAPGADPGDGLLDLVALEADSRHELLGLVPHLRAGTHVGRRGVRHLQARSLRISSGGRSPFIADTTNLGNGSVRLTAVPGALNLVGGSA
jgi:diacylglycerol kinase (ATP)